MKTVKLSARYAKMQAEYEAILRRSNRRPACKCKGHVHVCANAKQINADIRTAHRLAVRLNNYYKRALAGL